MKTEEEVGYQDLFFAIEHLRHFYRERKKLSEVISVISPSSTGVVEFGNKFIEDYIALAAKLVGDKNEWIAWYIWENDWGKNKMEVTSDGKKKRICNPHDLYHFCIKNI